MFLPNSLFGVIMSIDVITLGQSGVIADPDRKIDYLMCVFFFAKHSQSIYYPGMVSSLTKIIQMYGDDPVQIRKELESDLQVFLRQWFTTAAISVTVEDTGDNPGIKLLIDAIVSDGTSISPSSRSVGYSLLTKDSTLKSILNTTNGKELYPA